METLLFISLVLLAAFVFLYIRERCKVAQLIKGLREIERVLNAETWNRKIALFGSLAFLAFTIWKTRNDE